MRARILLAVVGAVVVLGPVSSASAYSLEDGLTKLAGCDTDAARPEVTDRDVDEKAEDRGLIPDVYTPAMGSDSDEDYRPLRGGLFAGEDPDGRDTNNLDLDGGLSILCN